MNKWIPTLAIPAFALLSGCVSSTGLNTQSSTNVRSYVERQSHRPDTSMMVVPASDLAIYAGSRQARAPSLIAMPDDKPAGRETSQTAEKGPEGVLPYNAVRRGEQVVSYRLGRQPDLKDPNVMHEAHDIYRVVESPSWILNAESVGVSYDTRDGRTEISGYQQSELSPRIALLEERSRMSEEADGLLIDSVRELKSTIVQLANEIAELKGEDPLVPALEAPVGEEDEDGTN